MISSFVRRHLAATALAALIAPVASAAAQQTIPAPQPETGPKVGEVAPNFSLPGATRYGRLRDPVSLSDLRGKTVVLNFWASWCAPCIEEFPSLMQLQKQMPDVVVLAVAFDTDEASYRQFIQDNSITGITTINDLNDTSNHSFGTYRPPETYIIDRNGIIRRKFIGMPAGGWTIPEIVNYLKHL